MAAAVKSMGRRTHSQLMKWQGLWVGQWKNAGEWTSNTAVGVGLAIAVILGFTLALCANNDFPHRFLRDLPHRKGRRYLGLPQLYKQTYYKRDDISHRVVQCL